MNAIAGVGSRETPSHIITIMEEIGAYVASKGIMVHSGNALGADQAFARGVNRVNPKMLKLFLPWASYENQAIVPGNVVVTDPEEDWYLIAAKVHPKWSSLKPGVQRLHARNIGIIGMGKHHVKQTICYMNHAKVGGGGTGQAVRYSLGLSIDVLDLATGEGLERVKKVLEAAKS